MTAISTIKLLITKKLNVWRLSTFKIWNQQIKIPKKGFGGGVDVQRPRKPPPTPRLRDHTSYTTLTCIPNTATFQNNLVNNVRCLIYLVQFRCSSLNFHNFRRNQYFFILKRANKSSFCLVFYIFQLMIFQSFKD